MMIIKRFLLLFLFFAIFSKVSAQMDTEHWFAPMVDRTGNPSQNQRLYLSTAETTPFEVKIFNNNIEIGKVTLSKGNPQTFNISNREIIIAKGDYGNADLFKPVKKGLYLKGERPFFSTLRFSVFNHAEIITSKGTAGIGNNFRAVMAPITTYTELDILNFMTSVLATEDNTKVKVSGFSKDVKFSDNISRTEFEFTLSKGESYIIEGIENRALTNKDGFIGSKIEADKPISVTNGNFNGQYAGDYPNSTDILMDQSVPEEKLGRDFVLVKGNGDNSFDSGTKSMERAIIVAVEDNTEIRLNADINPVAVINAGEFYITEPGIYIDQGQGHFNLFISTSKNAYVYQLLAGVGGDSSIDSSSSSEATGGFNYIPPLSCYLPKIIDEIGMINENRYTSNSIANELYVPTKLNIITEKFSKKDGALVPTIVELTENGVVRTLTPANGPYPVSGTSNWVTYSIPNVKGNVSITSTSAVTAGISAGNDAIGYGGYFAGFSYVPKILKLEGDCIGSLKLGVTDGFEFYQWQKKNVATGLYEDISGANNYILQPTEVGYYRVKLKEGSCTEVITLDYKVETCVSYSTQIFDICNDGVVIKPQLTDSSQIIAEMQIMKNPSKGTLTINEASGEIIYKPTIETADTDTFTYFIKGNNLDFPEMIEVEVKININVFQVKKATLTTCKVGSVGVFDLDLADVKTDLSLIIEGYYKTENGAKGKIESERILDFNNYSSAEAKVFARVENSFGCFNVAEIELKLYPTVEVDLNRYDFTQCETKFSGNVEINLNNVTQSIIVNNLYFTNVRYYDSLADAEIGTSAGLPNNWKYNVDTTIYMRIDSPDGCKPVILPLEFKVGDKISLATYSEVVEICDEDLDGKIRVSNLGSYKSVFTSDNTINAKFYQTKNDAIEDINSISGVDVDQQKTVFVRFYNSTLCPTLAELVIKVNKPKQSLILENKEICPDSKTSLNAGSGFTKYEWYNANDPSKLLGTEASISNLSVGRYFVKLTSDETGCIYTQNVEIKSVELPVIDAIEIEGQTVTIKASGGKAPYKYSVDNGAYQDSNIFYNVVQGLHTVNIISADNCAPVVKPFSIIKIFNVITPNDDGYNDVIDLSLLNYKEEPTFQVYDRYGRKVFEGSKNNNYIWNGKENGKPLPTSSYWYLIQWKDSANSPVVSLAGWILLKNRN